MATTTAPVGIDIAAVSGPLFIGYLLHWGLFGTLSVQLYIYYTAFPKDKTIVKCIVYFVYLLEICQTVLVTHDGLRAYGSGFGNYSALTQIGLLWLSLPIMSAVVSCIGQIFFAYRIRILTGLKAIPVFITVLALTSSVGGFMTGIYAGIDGRIDNLSNLRTSIAVITWDAASAFCDVFIAACMTFYLYRNRSAMQFGKTKSLLSKLIRLVIETGTATATLATLDLILYMVFPNQTFYCTVVLIIPKTYANTILVILNSRLQIVGGRDEKNFGTVINSNSVLRSVLFDNGTSTFQTDLCDPSMSHLSTVQQTGMNLLQSEHEREVHATNGRIQIAIHHESVRDKESNA
ncbi:hypothetical protein K435DRAFT_773329 [Dendrothele bispora CBS 962.96]|uniref:DUF6534 domain-containing protein n=1 Tax=Dendrothele bispora (strain CBS 962.96) TaxID=1314807 RepID=A0A4S8MTJ9_DENBC|nr:hypothetical protein K435DRAFT_773329 [Dendrothele bispora CBS 962.96]